MYCVCCAALPCGTDFRLCVPVGIDAASWGRFRCKSTLGSPALHLDLGHPGLMFSNIFCLQGLTRSIISDCDPRLTSEWWQLLCSKHRVRHMASTAYPPLQTNGLAERTNQTMKQMFLRRPLQRGHLVRSCAPRGNSHQ